MGTIEDTSTIINNIYINDSTFHLSRNKRSVSHKIFNTK